MESYALPEPVLEGPLPDTPREIKDEKQEKPKEKTKPAGNGDKLSQKERVLEEIQALMTGDDVVAYQGSLNSKIKGLKSPDVIDISRAFDVKRLDLCGRAPGAA